MTTKIMSSVRVVVTLAIVLGVCAQSYAQGNYGRQDLLEILARGDISLIPQDQAHYLAVAASMMAIGYSNCSMQEPNLTLYEPYIPFILDRLEKKIGSNVPFGQIVVQTHPRYLESIVLVGTKGCNSHEVQSIMESEMRFGLGQDPVDLSAPYPLATTKIRDLSYAQIDNYCKYEGRKDPACSQLVGFIFGRPEPSCFDGLNIPAAPEPPQVVVCGYELVINEETGWKSGSRFTYWYQSMPKKLGSLLVHGVDQFSSVAPVAVTSCPKDSKEAERLSGNRRGVPIGPGENYMPKPPPDSSVPGCVTEPAVKQDTVPQDFAEGDYQMLESAEPVYPPRALSRGMQGHVDVQFTVTEKGTVKDPTVVSSSSAIFDRAAIRTVQKYRFKPRVVGGQPVEVTGITLRVEFEIPE